jgi:hypothetical protein
MARRINKHYFTICQRGDNDSFHSTHLCLITTNVAHADAIGFHRIRSFELMTLKCQYTYISESHWWVTDRLLGRSLKGQPRPDKNMNFLCTAASFTAAIRSRGFVVLCQLTSSFRLILCPCSSARKFASGYSDRDRWLKCRFCRSKNLPDQTSRSSPCHSLVVNF